MNTLELKGSLTDLIASVQDEDLLKELLRVVRSTISKKKGEEPDWWDELSPAQQKELDEALEASFDEANWVSEKEARIQIYSKLIDLEMDKLWVEKGWDEQTIEGWKNEHMRTPYRK